MSKERQQHKLLPCPFCGHTAQIAEEDERHRPNIVCPCCGVRVYGDTMTLAKYKWNMRAE